MLDIHGYEAEAIQFGACAPKIHWRRPDGDRLTTGFDQLYPVNVGVSPSSGTLLVNWHALRESSVVDGFYDRQLGAKDELQTSDCDLQTVWSDLLEVADATDAAPLAGMIFHAARCGSTLIHRMINRCDSTFSLCEPRVLGGLLADGANWQGVDQAGALRALLHLLGRKPAPTKTGFVVKFTDTIAIVIDRVRALLPAVPSLFVYRDPHEVLVSILQTPTGTVRQWRADPDHAGLKLVRPELTHTGLQEDEVAARVLGAIYRSVVASAAQVANMSPLCVIDYDSLPGSFFSVIAPHFGMRLMPEDVIRAEEVASEYSKSAMARQFVSDREEKRRLVTPRIADLVGRFVEPHAAQCRRLCVA